MCAGSTDMGDLSCIMPVIHFYVGGSQGRFHGDDFRIADPEAACVDSAKLQLGLVQLLLENDAQMAKNVAADYQPVFASKEDYFAFMDSLDSAGDRITYQNDGTAAVNIR